MSSRVYSGRKSSEPKPNPSAPAASQRRDVAGTDAADRKHLHRAGEHCLQGPQVWWAVRDGGKELELGRAGVDRGERLGGRAQFRASRCMPSCSARSITATSQFGATTRRPPASCVRCTSSACSTVPAPIRQSEPCVSASSAMLRNGSGELSGTSMMRMPARCSARADRRHTLGRHTAQDRDESLSDARSNQVAMHRYRVRQQPMHVHEAGERCCRAVDRPRFASLGRERGGVETRRAVVRRRCGPCAAVPSRIAASAPLTSLAIIRPDR